MCPQLPAPQSPVGAPALAGAPGLSSALHVLAGWGSEHNIRVVETNYKEYAMVFTQISKSTGSSNMVLLYSTSALEPLLPPCPQPWDVFSGRRRAASSSKLG